METFRQEDKCVDIRTGRSLYGLSAVQGRGLSQVTDTGDTNGRQKEEEVRGLMNRALTFWPELNAVLAGPTTKPSRPWRSGEVEDFLDSDNGRPNKRKRSSTTTDGHRYGGLEQTRKNQLLTGSSAWLLADNGPIIRTRIIGTVHRKTRYWYK